MSDMDRHTLISALRHSQKGPDDENHQYCSGVMRR
jgi:hypothetical protein